MRKLKIIVVAGARPNFMKVGPFIKQRALYNASKSSNAPEVDARLVHTGQHYDTNMSEIFFRSSESDSRTLISALAQEHTPPKRPGS